LQLSSKSMRRASPFFDQLFVERVGDLDALLFERQRLEVAAASRLLLRPLLLLVLAVLVGRRVGRRDRERAGERVELAELLGELHLELRGVDALGLGDEDASLEHLELDAQALVRGTELIALPGERGDLLPLDRERGFEVGNSCVAAGVTLEHRQRAHV
jgi:hypothetical protein